MNILVTGYPGFLAKNLALAIADNSEHNFTFVNRLNNSINNCIFGKNLSYWYCNLEHEESVKWMMNCIKHDVVVHCAANADNSKDGGFKVYEDNVKMCHNLLDYCKEGTRFLLTSSSAVYGNIAEYNGSPCKEEDGVCPSSLYGASKVACETLVRVYTEQGKVHGLSLRFPAMVGPHMTHGVLKDVLRKIDSDSEVIELFGEYPGSTKPFLHVSDAILAINVFMKKLLVGELNICPSDSISVMSLATIVMGVRNRIKLVNFGGQNTVWSGDNRYVSMSNAGMQEVGLAPPMTSREAIERAVSEN